jgi:putative membrane protein
VPEFLQLSILLHISFALGVLVFIIVIERPMKANFRVGPLELANAFLAHLSEGSRKLDDFFRSVGESIVVPQVSLVLERAGKERIVVTIPNVHPGPLGDWREQPPEDPPRDAREGIAGLSRLCFARF